MEIKELLVGEYTGTIAPRIAGSVHILRNRTRIFESDKPPDMRLWPERFEALLAERARLQVAYDAAFVLSEARHG